VLILDTRFLLLTWHEVTSCAEVPLRNYSLIHPMTVSAGSRLQGR